MNMVNENIFLDKLCIHKYIVHQPTYETKWQVSKESWMTAELILSLKGSKFNVYIDEHDTSIVVSVMHL